MKKYYIIGTIAAAVLFALTIAVVWCIYAVYKGRVDDLISDLNENSVVLRYYADEEFDTSEVIYIRVRDKENYQLDQLPVKEGCIFVGLFDVKTDQQYVTSDGYGIVALTDDILLYAKFQEI